MGLRTKLFLPAILGFATLAVVIHFFWVPDYLTHERDRFIQSQVKLVSTLEPEIARHILEGDVAALHVSLDKQIELNQPAWLSVSVFNLENNRLYPIASPQHFSGDNIYQHKHPIVFGDQPIATLNLDLDWQPYLDEDLEQIYRVELMILITIGIIGLASMFWLNSAFRTPLDHLERAAARLSEGDFTAPLPKQSGDEIGKLSHSFALMRTSLQSSQTELSAALAESQSNADKYRHEVKLREALYGLQDISLSSSNQQELLDKTLQKLLSLDFLDIENKGAILLVEDEPEVLVLKSKHHLAPQQETRCARIDFGHCLCGRAVASGECIFSPCVDEHHESKFDGMEAHGHYNIPIKLGEKVLGVMAFYLPHGCQRNEIEMEFLASAADILASAINRLNYEGELHKNNVALTRAKQEAESSSRAKSDFLATMSHELRTPLNGVLGMAQLLRMTELDDEQIGYIDTLINSGTSLVTIINDILDFSKIEAGKLTVEEIAFDMQRAAQDVVQLLLPRAQEKGLALNLHYAQECDDYFLGDPGRIRQILMNLIGNAVKFTHQGHIDVDIKCVCLSQEICRVNVAITDSGIGIAPETQQRLFESFSQADTSTTRRYGGTGLGLAISKRLVELMGGTIGVNSTPGAGSTFWFRLDLHKQAVPELQRQLESSHLVAAQPAVTEKEAESRPRFSGTILVVEDNFVNQRLVVSILDKLGLAHEVASNGKEAFRLWESGRFDLILMDCQMPVLDGFEATRLIRQHEQNRHTPIIALTANAMEHDKLRSQEAGMDDHLSKPFQIEQLISILGRWLPEATASERRGVTLIDISALDKIERDIDDALFEIVPIFIRDTKSILEQMALDYQAGEFDLLQRHAHTLKSNAANFGAASLLKLTLRLEQLLQKRENSEIFNCIEEMRQLFPSVAAALEQEMAKRQARSA